MKIRVGFGYDVHALVSDRDLWLGGIKIEHTLGLLGHSDADVLIHAICDALLGAARRSAPWLPPQFGPGTRLKVYVRDRDDLPLVAAALEQRFGDRVPRVLLHAAICRRELSMEIDGVHG